MAKERFFCKALVGCLFAAAAFLIFSCASGGLQGKDESAQDFLSQEEADFPQEIFLPERFDETFVGTSAATFKTSVPKAALYINGEYHGLTPLMARNLIPGRYAVQIKKEGYKTVNIAIQIKDGISDFYYIEMTVQPEPEPEPLPEPEALPAEAR